MTHQNLAVRNETGGLLITNAIVVKETPKAMLISGYTNPISRNDVIFVSGWVPKSCINFTDGDAEGTIVIGGWIAGRKIFFEA